jgi:hypothetical protein
MEIIIAFLIGFGGFSFYKSEQEIHAAERQVAIEEAISTVESEFKPKNEDHVYARGKYIPRRGYYISNLSPVPPVADGCELPVLTTDLSKPRKEVPVSVSSAEVRC